MAVSSQGRATPLPDGRSIALNISEAGGLGPVPVVAEAPYSLDGLVLCAVERGSLSSYLVIRTPVMIAARNQVAPTISFSDLRADLYSDRSRRPVA
jgi:hypothetical protein